MAHMWVLSDGSEWRPCVLAAGTVGLTASGPAAGNDVVLLRRVQVHGGETWVLLTEHGDELLINGRSARPETVARSQPTALDAGFRWTSKAL